MVSVMNKIGMGKAAINANMLVAPIAPLAIITVCAIAMILNGLLPSPFYNGQPNHSVQ